MKKTIAAACLVMFMWTAAACGGAEEGEPSAADSHTPSATASVFPPEPAASQPDPYRQVANLSEDLDQDGNPDNILLETYSDKTGQHIRLKVNDAVSNEYLYDNAYGNVRLMGTALDDEGRRGGIAAGLSGDGQETKPEYLILSYSGGRLETILDNSNSGQFITTASPDARRILYSTRPHLAVDLMDFGTHKWRRFELPGMSTGLERTEWIGDGRIGITAHVNPSTSAYFLLDAAAGQWIGQYYGAGFTWVGSRFYYYKPQPHFSDIRGKDQILDGDGNVLYESPDRISIWGDVLYFNEEGSRVAFYEMNADTNVQKLVTARLTPSGRLKVGKKVKWESSAGTVFWENDKRITVTDGGSSLSVELEG